MKMFRIAVVFVSALFAVPAFASDLPASFADLVDKLSPAVVNISTTQKVKGGQMQVTPFGELPDTPEMEPFRQFFEQFGQKQGKEDVERDVYSLGSGFIIDASGYIITNNHVIDDADDIQVIMTDHSKYKAKLVGRDKKTDLALLKIDAKKDLPFVVLGDSDAVRVGDWVIAIGNPYGLGGTVTHGIISARERSINAGPFDDFLQTDAPINRGNSGGPLFNEKGEVVGINSAIFSPSGGSIGIGFAVPTALAKPVIAQLKEFGKTHRGWLGVKIQEVSDEVAESVGLPKAEGALVLEVSKGSPADKAGIQVGDVITKFDGKEITEMRFLPRMVAETKIGKTVDITYWRKNASKTAQISVGELDEKDEAADDGDDAGKAVKGKTAGSQVMSMTLAPLNEELRKERHIEGHLAGLIVLDVKVGSEAGKRGVQAGDVITDVNNEPVKTVDEFKKALDSAKKTGHNFALVRISREKDEAFITLPTAEDKKAEKDDKKEDTKDKQE